MNFRTILIIINVVAVAAIVGDHHLPGRQPPAQPRAEEARRTSTPFLDDEELEGRHLERVLGWALLFSHDRRGRAAALLAARAEPPERRGRRLRRAGGRAGRGRCSPTSRCEALRPRQVAAVRRLPRRRRQRRLGELRHHGPRRPAATRPPVSPTARRRHECLPLNRCTWRGAATRRRAAALRPSSRSPRSSPTAAPAPRCRRGASKSGKGRMNEQGVSDLVAYLKSIQITPAKAKAAGAASPTLARRGRQGRARRPRRTLADARRARWRDADRPPTSARSRAGQDVDGAQTAIDALDGLRTTTCSRRARASSCSTQLRPLPHQGLVVQRPAEPGRGARARPAGGGAYGPNLTDGSDARASSPVADDTDADSKQYDWVGERRPANKAYGVRGISSGRMPHFGDILTKDQIDADHRVRAEPVDAEARVSLFILAAGGASTRRPLVPDDPRGPRRHRRRSASSAARSTCCSATNLGARLGFLVAFTGLMGFMVAARRRCGSRPRRRSTR